jgi:rare lipoprotein A
LASWYGNPYHGRTTASGETYDMNEMTCAHPTLPFGTRLRVQNLDNGRSVTVRVNDRGPFVKDRILDVSRKAARELGMIGPGTARVRITVVGSGGGVEEEPLPPLPAWGSVPILFLRD